MVAAGSGDGVAVMTVASCGGMAYKSIPKNAKKEEVTINWSYSGGNSKYDEMPTPTPTMTRTMKSDDNSDAKNS